MATTENENLDFDVSVTMSAEDWGKLAGDLLALNEYPSGKHTAGERIEFVDHIAARVFEQIIANEMGNLREVNGL